MKDAPTQKFTLNHREPSEADQQACKMNLIARSQQLFWYSLFDFLPCIKETRQLETALFVI